mgnify:CR=1 FL=1
MQRTFGQGGDGGKPTFRGKVRWFGSLTTAELMEAVQAAAGAAAGAAAAAAGKEEEEGKAGAGGQEGPRVQAALRLPECLDTALHPDGMRSVHRWMPGGPNRVLDVQVRVWGGGLWGWGGVGWVGVCGLRARNMARTQDEVGWAGLGWTACGDRTDKRQRTHTDTHTHTHTHSPSRSRFPIITRTQAAPRGFVFYPISLPTAGPGGSRLVWSMYADMPVLQAAGVDFPPPPPPQPAGVNSSGGAVAAAPSADAPAADDAHGAHVGGSRECLVGHGRACGRGRVGAGVG